MFDEFCEMLKRRINQNKDAVIAITGAEGEGKSTLAILLGKAIDKNFTLANNELIKPSAEELTDKVTTLPKGSVIICDESMRFLYKQEWQSRKQKFLNKLFSLCRQEEKIVFLVLPRFSDLNSYFRGWRVLSWIHVIERGHAILFSRDWSPFAPDIWWMEANQKLIEKYRGHKRLASYDVNDKKKLLSRVKNFIGDFEFPDLDEATKAEYLKMKAEISYSEDMMDEDSRSMREKRHLEELAKTISILISKGETQTSIAKQIGSNQQRISKLLTYNSKTTTT